MVTVYRCVRGELRDVKWQPEDLLLSSQTNDEAVMCVSRQSRRVLPSDCCPVNQCDSQPHTGSYC